MKVQVKHFEVLLHNFERISNKSLPFEVSVERSAWMLCQLPLQLMLPVWLLLDCYISWLKTDGGLEGALMQSGVFQCLNWTFMMQIYSNCITHLIRYDFRRFYILYVYSHWHLMTCVMCVYFFVNALKGHKTMEACSCMWQVLFASKEDPLERVAASATGIVTFDPQWYPWSPWGSRALRFISFPSNWSKSTRTSPCFLKFEPIYFWIHLA